MPYIVTSMPKHTLKPLELLFDGAGPALQQACASLTIGHTEVSISDGQGWRIEGEELEEACRKGELRSGGRFDSGKR